MYIHRAIEKYLSKAEKSHECIVIYGPRQIGKSTLLGFNKGNSYKIITLDDYDKKVLAINDPEQFFKIYNPPLVIDEIQLAPQLLSQIKIIIDNTRLTNLKNNTLNKHLIYLTSSQQYDLKEDIVESLAGRISIVEMNSLSHVEIKGIESNWFNPDIEVLLKKNMNTKCRNRLEIFEDILIGGMPRIITKEADRTVFFESYIDIYLENDIKRLINVGHDIQFRNFLRKLAFLTAQELKYNELSNSLGIDVRTVKKWISILESTGIIKILQPFMSNLSNSLIKSPKVYFMDTGLCTFLCGWHDSFMLEACAMSGALMETYVVSEIIKSFLNAGKRISNNLYFYRDKNQKEIDLIYYDINKIIPIEIKKGINPVSYNKNFNVLDKFGLEVKPGIIIYSGDEIKCLNKNAYLVPIDMIGL